MSCASRMAFSGSCALLGGNGRCLAHARTTRRGGRALVRASASILEQLAASMVKLACLEFDAIGRLGCIDPSDIEKSVRVVPLYGYPIQWEDEFIDPSSHLAGRRRDLCELFISRVPRTVLLPSQMRTAWQCIVCCTTLLGDGVHFRTCNMICSRPTGTVEYLVTRPFVRFFVGDKS
ncbi:hypothetical protein PENSPDRAFT_388068 [Peniophora sp. CONT]|nr:hypothetical protein PENSPDRAFT_388068 [Peniophora sp. CONT]